MRDSVSKQVFLRIKSAIVQGQWKPGQRLPSESELAEGFGVSRISVRSALQSLSALNIIETRNGEGTFVRNFELSHVLTDVVDLIVDSVTTEDFNEYRYCFETDIIRLIAKKQPTPSAFDILEECCNRMAAAAKELDYLDYNNWDYKFHQALCQICGNRMFEYAYGLFEAMYKHYYALNVRQANTVSAEELANWSKSVEFHRELCRSLKEGRYDDAINAIGIITSQ